MDHQPVETTLYSLTDLPPEQAARRRDERHISLLRVGTLIIEDRRELCLIRTVSAGGLTIRAYSELSRGDPIAVELLNDRPMSGKVAWVSEASVGIAFDERIDVLGLLGPPSDGFALRRPRIQLRAIASVREGAFVRRTHLINISQGGACVESSVPLTVGAAVTVSLIGLAPAPGLVKWREGENFGIGFNRPFALPELVDWLHAAQQRQPARDACRSSAGGE